MSDPTHDGKKAIPFRVTMKQKKALIDCARERQLSIQKLLEDLVFPHLSDYLHPPREGRGQ